MAASVVLDDDSTIAIDPAISLPFGSRSGGGCPVSSATYCWITCCQAFDDATIPVYDAKSERLIKAPRDAYVRSSSAIPGFIVLAR
jgi:hypothetical protein